MAYYVYVSISGEGRVDVYSMDPETGSLDKRQEVALSGNPAGIAADPQRRFLYIARRGIPEMASFAVDQSDGSLTLLGSIAEESDSVYVTVDSTGRFVLSSSNGGALARSYRVGDDGALVGPPASIAHTLPGAHSVEVHPSNRFVYVPQCISQNAIFQFRYDGDTGQITPQELAVLVPPTRVGPRHIRFHPSLDVMYTTNEQDSSISAYGVGEDGMLSPAFQTISTLPDDFEGENTTAQLRVHRSGKFLYAPNRGHESIACFSIDSASGELTLIGRVPTEAHTRGMDIDPQGKFLFAAGAESGNMSAYAIDGDSGELTHLQTYEVGQAPLWVLAIEVG